MRVVLLFLLLAALAGVAWSADVWNETPRDALGVVVVRDLAAVDAKASRLLRAVQVRLPGPLALVKAATGVDQGLDPQGDLLLVVLPGQGDADRPQLAVWLPVTDYDQLVRSLEGVPRERITAVTIAGEDVLIAQHGGWAVVMDPGARRRLEQVLDAAPAPKPPLAKLGTWTDWIRSNDVTAVLFQSGVQRALATVVATDDADQSAPGEVPPEGVGQPVDEDDLFGGFARDPAADRWQAVRAEIRAGLSDMPELSHRLFETTAAGWGLRVDAEGNAVTGLRLAWRPDAARGSAEDKTAVIPPLYDGGQFVVASGGQVSRAWAVAVAGPYARLLARDLNIDEHGQAETAAVQGFRESLARAAGDVAAFAALTQPGSGSDGVYTNSFLVVRVEAADAFMQHAADVIARWNKVAGHGRDDVRLEFAAEPVQIAGRSATQYSVDMTAAVGGPAIPELRQSMERLFGPGGKLRLQLVPVDDRTVLVAAATDQQAAKMFHLVAQGGPPRWDRDELQPTSRLMTSDADWRVFVSPHGYVRWLQRQMDAIVGPVFGGPLVKDFPASPPIGVAGGGTNDGIWIEVVAPAGTMEAFGHVMRD